MCEIIHISANFLLFANIFFTGYYVASPTALLKSRLGYIINLAAHKVTIIRRCCSRESRDATFLLSCYTRSRKWNTKITKELISI